MRPVLYALALLGVAVLGTVMLVARHCNRRTEAALALSAARLAAVRDVANELFERCRVRALEPAESPFWSTPLGDDRQVLEAEFACRNLMPELPVTVTLPRLRGSDPPRAGTTPTSVYEVGTEARDAGVARRAYVVEPSLLAGEGAIDVCVSEVLPDADGPSSLCVAYLRE